MGSYLRNLRQPIRLTGVGAGVNPRFFAGEDAVFEKSGRCLGSSPIARMTAGRRRDRQDPTARQPPTPLSNRLCPEGHLGPAAGPVGFALEAVVQVDRVQMGLKFQEVSLLQVSGSGLGVLRS